MAHFLSYKISISLGLITTLALVGCQSQSAPDSKPLAISNAAPTSQPTASDPLIATVDGVPILRSQFEPELVEAYGMPILLNVVQLTLAKELVHHAGITVTAADIQAEHDRTFAKLFSDAPKSDDETLFKQLLEQRHLTKVEFDLVIETNAYLRKFARPQMKGKITEEDVRKAFGQLYGENRVVRDIELTNLAEVGEAKRRLAAKESFAQVAGEMSIDSHTRPLGGELPPFSNASPNVPKALRDTAFTLPVGQVSDPINTGNSYHLIMVVRIIPPRVIKFDDVKDSVRKKLEGQWMELSVKALRRQLGAIALHTLHVDQPELALQWKTKVDQERLTMKQRQAISENLNANPAPTSQPTTAPAH